MKNQKPIRIIKHKTKKRKEKKRKRKRKRKASSSAFALITANRKVNSLGAAALLSTLHYVSIYLWCELRVREVCVKGVSVSVCVSQA
ncbi:hypothetical protein BDQ94DRAFT_144946 [Aspergillus welwitschiae]|uniref:Uncharacterized protein n=1 Tax=Aspergillus welwitschiae TaxID=1341132 RepID=A0A3F3Q0I5_9EURO|nr:hypothetical protein BDQ94DRAFT_144946 [Aspergillus welwitschiae]RDH32743.1 hypothetical protein BDQ94DRAFT_144946 [Aspergillus welwitschiae]